jgi:hypothetical protein
MSLSHTIFGLPPHEREEAIKSLARKALRRVERGGNARRGFDQLIRPLLHAKHAAGSTKDEVKSLRREWREIFHTVNGEREEK